MKEGVKVRLEDGKEGVVTHIFSAHPYKGDAVVRVGDSLQLVGLETLELVEERVGNDATI